MSGDILESRGRWAAAALGAIAIVATLVFLVRLPPPPVLLSSPAYPDAPKTVVKMARPNETDLLLKDETALRDLRPLFLPTERNAALPDPRLEPGRTFLDNENPRFVFPDADVRISEQLPPVIRLNGKPLEQAEPRDVFAAGGGDISLLGFGRSPVSSAPFEPRGGFIEVTDTRDGATAWTEKLPLAARPPGDKPWAPVEFLAVVDTTGLASPLVVTESSRVEEVDAHFRLFLTRDFRLGSRLVPGFYRIIVAP